MYLIIMIIALALTLAIASTISHLYKVNKYLEDTYKSLDSLQQTCAEHNQYLLILHKRLKSLEGKINKKCY